MVRYNLSGEPSADSVNNSKFLNCNLLSKEISNLRCSTYFSVASLHFFLYYSSPEFIRKPKFHLKKSSNRKYLTDQLKTFCLRKMVYTNLFKAVIQLWSHGKVSGLKDVLGKNLSLALD